MAGSYVDVPGRRIPYDRDGTIGLAYNSTDGNYQLWTTGQLQALNNEATSGLSSDGLDTANNNSDVRYYTLIFPALMDIAGWYINVNTTSGWTRLGIETSADTTNGIDGIWTSRVGSGFPVSTTGVIPTYRSEINAVSWAGVKAIRIQWTSFSGGGPPAWSAIHYYGSLSAAAPRLALWHPTLDQEVTGAYFDWGDVPTSTSATRDFRVKNLSTTQTAQSVGLTMEALYDTSPTVVGQHTFSPDGTTFTSTLNIGSLAPSAISSVLTLKRTTPSNASLSLWAARIIALPGAWV